MNKIERLILKMVLKNPCPFRIPRSEKLGKQVDCYSICLYDGESPIMHVLSIDDNGISGRYFEDGIFRTEATIPIAYYSGLQIEIRHFHGLIDHIYSGYFDYVLHEWTMYYKLQSVYKSFKHSIPQFFFNKSNLQLPQRMKILENIIARQLDDPNKSFTSLELLSYMYSLRFYLHPQRTEVRKKLDLYLSSFEASGELRRSGGSVEYFITGKAIATLEQY